MPSALIRSTTARIAVALARIASTAVRACVVTPAPTVAMSGSASTLSCTVRATTGPVAATWTSAAAGKATAAVTASGKA